MTIRYLEIFVEVCKYMNMSRAAQSLMISQSSVSQAVKALEKEYNVLLFERLNHNLYLTAAGEKMLYLATQVLKSIGRLNSAMHNAPVSLNIGSCNTVGASFLYPLLAEFKKLSPDIHISAEISNTQTLTEKILNSSLDLAIVPETVQQAAAELREVKQWEAAMQRMTQQPRNQRATDPTAWIPKTVQRIWMEKRKQKVRKSATEHPKME